MNLEEINDYLLGLATLEEVANLLSKDYKELCNFIKEKTGIEPLEYQKRKHLETKILVKKKILELALNGDKNMLMFVAKTYLDNKTIPFQRQIDYSEFLDLLN